MPTRRCCCTGTDCVICEDNFDRADENPVTGSWVEKSGDWAVSGQTLEAVTDGVLLTSCRQSLPVGTTYNYRILVDLVDTATNWKVICKYTDSTNFDWIEIYTSGTDLFPKFWRRTGGTDSLVMDITTHPAGTALQLWSGGKTSIEICYAEVGWTVSGGPSTWTTCNATAPTALPADTTVGFVGFMAGDFDNFIYLYHKLSLAICPNCDCYCVDPGDTTDRKCIPEVLTLTLTPVVTHTDCTTSPGTLTYTLRQCLPTRPAYPTQPTYTIHPEKKYWYSDPVDEYEPILFSIPFWFRMECLGNGLFELIMLQYGADDSVPFETGRVQFSVQDGANGGAINTAVACTPIVITFPRLIKRLLQIGSGDEAPFSCVPFDALEYTAVVTE